MKVLVLESLLEAYDRAGRLNRLQSYMQKKLKQARRQDDKFDKVPKNPAGGPRDPQHMRHVALRIAAMHAHMRAASLYNRKSYPMFRSHLDGAQKVTRRKEQNWYTKLAKKKLWIKPKDKQ